MIITEEQKIIEDKLLGVFKDLGIYVDVNDFNADIIDVSLQFSGCI
ncbi:hypothetical protein [Nosocomiicoccus ampullae]|uniref:Uncharacterized protein n=1 Tax=Nosocomiicoccus ampullae TaxID=489910 RepID=A0A9Q2CW33_9STAP|nr:hypothetical protein [Nosocomiicoccus ampullae]MBB5175189.1 hypothetical protein [Nosocomiicoccus ampullae]QYA46432.1 hypothetical protein KPF49_05360 [Nosocomiicoccus ampullae]